MVTTIWQYVNGTVQFVYYLGGISIAITAIVALKQISLAKKDISIRSKREAAATAATQCDRFAKEVIPSWDKLIELLQSEGFESELPYRHDIEEVKRADFDNTVAKWRKSKVFQSEQLSTHVASFLNQLESVAIYFTKGIADEEIAFPSLGRGYCDAVRVLYPAILYNYIENGIYTNVVELFNIWNARLQIGKLSEQVDSLMVKLGAVSNKSVAPIGTRLD